VAVREGLPVDVILRTATDYACEMIIIGNRAHGEVATLLSGSTSQRVIAHARVPVLVVRA
jgi:nucleotide-binding universal stress UspA family protein